MAVVARKRSRGVVYWVATWCDGRIHWERSGHDRREAERLDARRKREVQAGTFRAGVGGASQTVRAFAERWCSERDVKAAGTERQLVTDYALSRPWFASLQLSEVRPRHMVKLAAELRTAPRRSGPDPLSGKSVSNLFGVLRTMFRDAQLAELVNSNPVALPRGTLTRSGAQREAYSAEQAQALIVGAGDWSRLVWNALALCTGMREGEVCGRRWRDWEPEANPLGALRVDSQYDGQPLKVDNPRRVPVLPELGALLTWWHDVGFELVHRRKPAPEDWIVPHTRLGCHTKSSAYKAWRRSCKIASVANLSLHSTRHTFLTLARRGGARKDVIERVTHNARGEIVDVYTHWDWTPLCEAVLCFPRLFDFDADFDALTYGAEKMPVRGSSAWTRTRETFSKIGATGVVGETSETDEPSNAAETRYPAADLAARQSTPRRLLEALEVRHPSEFMVALADAADGALAQDQERCLRPLAKAAELLPLRRHHVG